MSADFVDFKGHRYRLSGNYYRGSKEGGGFTNLHRAVWTDAYGSIPDGHHIHHIDGNPLNNDISNLDCVSRSDHLREHSRQLVAEGRLRPPTEYALARAANGTHPMPETNGIASTASEYSTASRGLNAFARAVVSRLCRLSLGRPNGATSIAKWKISTAGEASSKIPVHDLTVENHACYQANGVLVSNSDAWRYMSLAWRELAPEKPPPPPIDTWARAFEQAGRDEVEGWRVA